LKLSFFLLLQPFEYRNQLIEIFNWDFLFSKPRTKKGKIDCALINPKSVTLDELYGKSDINTLEWTDGLLANTLRQFISSVKNTVEMDVCWHFPWIPANSMSHMVTKLSFDLLSSKK
jgi:hypothetical protein